jgi:hypothetical protein
VAGRALVGAYCAIELRLRRKILKKKAPSEFLKTHGAPLTYKSLQKKPKAMCSTAKGMDGVAIRSVLARSKTVMLSWP